MQLGWFILGEMYCDVGVEGEKVVVEVFCGWLREYG